MPNCFHFPVHFKRKNKSRSINHYFNFCNVFSYVKFLFIVLLPYVKIFWSTFCQFHLMTILDYWWSVVFQKNLKSSLIINHIIKYTITLFTSFSHLTLKYHYILIKRMSALSLWRTKKLKCSWKIFLDSHLPEIMNFSSISFSLSGLWQLRIKFSNLPLLGWMTFCRTGSHRTHYFFFGFFIESTGTMFIIKPSR